MQLKICRSLLLKIRKPGAKKSKRVGATTDVTDVRCLSADGQPNGQRGDRCPASPVNTQSEHTDNTHTQFTHTG